MNAPPPVVLRVNPLKADVPGALAALAADGAAVAHENGRSVALPRCADAAGLGAFGRGLVHP